MRDHRADRLTWLLWPLYLVIATLSLPLFVLTWSSPERPWWTTAIYLAQLPLYFVSQTIGTLVITRRGAQPVGWILVALGLIVVTSGFAAAYATYALFVAPGALPGGRMMAWFSNWITDPGLYLVGVFLPLLFPSGLLASRRLQALACLGGAGMILLASYTALAPGPLRVFPMLTNPYGVAGPAGQVVKLLGLGFFLLLALTPVSALIVIARMRRAAGDERQQLKLFAASAVLLAVGLAVILVLGNILGVPNALVRIPLELALAGLPIVAGVAVLEYRLYAIDVLINRTLVYGALTICIVGLYAGVVEVAGALLRGSYNLAASLIATGLIAVLVQPARQWLQHCVNRLLYGERHDPYRILSRLGDHLENALAPDAVLPATVETIARALRLPYAAVALRHGGDCCITAVWGTEVAETLRLPLVYQHELIGELRVAPRSAGGAFTATDRRLLNGLARQVGVAVHAVRLTADLQGARERLVLAREEERRRLRRNLHDGLGPRLAGLTLKLEAARNHLAHEPLADGLLTDLASQAQAAVVDIRRLVDGLRPPALDDLGLVSALCETAAHYSGPGSSGLQISVEAPADLSTLPAAVEVAAYRIAQEALTNVVRHAGASRCLVRLALPEQPRRLQLEVCDDGRGFEPLAGAGLGLASMRERAEELGGTCAVQTLPEGGTCVQAELPCGAAHEDQRRLPESGVMQ